MKSHDSGFTSMPTEVLAEPSSDAEFECEDEQGLQFTANSVHNFHPGLQEVE